MSVRAALLDENGVYLRMDELADPLDLTSSHLPQITSCDLPPGQYRWIARGSKNMSPEVEQALGSVRDNEYGGTFVPLKWIARVERDARDVKDSKEREEKIKARRAARKRERGE